MADERIKDFTGAVSSAQIGALLDTLYLAVDDTSFTDAKKILLKSILTTAVVDASTNNYQAMTPKAFYDSVMTTTRKGIGQLALDADVTNKTGTGLLNSVHQALMQAQWFKDWFVKNEYAPKAIISDTGDLTTAKAVAYQAVFSGAVAANELIYLHPAELQDAGKSFNNVYMSYVYDRIGILGYGNINLAINDGGVQTIAQGQFYFRLNRATNYLAMYTPFTSSSVKISATINAIIEG